jgi:plasmid segregation protein ParM
MLLDGLKERGFDLAFNAVYFIGGGALLLKPFILKSGKAKKPIFIELTNANAVGYLKMAKALDGNR